MQTRNSLVPTKSVNVNIGNYSKYIFWMAKVLFYVCILSIATKIIAKITNRVGFDFNYILLGAITLLFIYNGHMSHLIDI